MLPKDVDRMRAQAEAAFKVRQPTDTSPAAVREYREAQQAQRDKTQRLREQRLARTKQSG